MYFVKEAESKLKPYLANQMIFMFDMLNLCFINLKIQLNTNLSKTIQRPWFHLLYCWIIQRPKCSFNPRLSEGHYYICSNMVIINSYWITLERIMIHKINEFNKQNFVMIMVSKQFTSDSHFILFLALHQFQQQQKKLEKLMKWKFKSMINGDVRNMNMKYVFIFFCHLEFLLEILIKYKAGKI